MFGFLLIIVFLSLVFLVVSSPSKIWTDCQTPLNLLLFQEPKISYPSQFVNVWVNKEWTLNGSKIPCLLEEYHESDQLIIFSHSFQDNLLTIYPFIVRLSKVLKVSVVTYDYSGYGLNELDTFERSSPGINATLGSVYNHFSKTFQPSKITLMGCSLGTGCSISLAADLGKNLKSLILLSGFSSVNDLINDVWKHKIGYGMAAELNSFFLERWNNINTISVVKVPTLILHGKYDQVVPLKCAQRLKQSMSSQCKLVELNSGHLSFHWDDVFDQIVTWF